MAEAHARRYSCHFIALCPQVQQAIHDFLEEAVTAYLHTTGLSHTAELTIQQLRMFFSADSKLARLIMIVIVCQCKTCGECSE